MKRDYVLSDDDHLDLANAYDQDKELRWLERDRARAQSALLAVSADVDDETLRALQVEYASARDRLELAKREIRERLLPQFQARAKARARGGNAVVFTPAEEMQLTLPERHELMIGTRRNTLAFELKEMAQERLRHRGWDPTKVSLGGPHVSGASSDALPLPSSRQWKVYATVAAVVGLGVAAPTLAASDGGNGVPASGGGTSTP